MALIVALVTPQTHYVRTADIPYAEGARGKLDVYVPRAAHAGAPMVVFVYGGSWDSGEKAVYRFVGAALASRGVVVAIPDYRVYPEVRWPAFLDDNAMAVRWAKDHAADYGADPGKLFLMGHSAGAYDVAMLGLDRRWLGAVGLDPRRDVRGVIGLSGPYDFLPLVKPELKTIFGPEDRLPDTQPINHVDGQAPPFLMVAGEADTTVYPRNTVHLAKAITARGGQAETVFYPGIKHVGTVTSFLPVFGSHIDVPRRVLAFIRKLSAGAAVKAAA